MTTSSTRRVPVTAQEFSDGLAACVAAHPGPVAIGDLAVAIGRARDPQEYDLPTRLVQTHLDKGIEDGTIVAARHPEIDTVIGKRPFAGYRSNTRYYAPAKLAEQWLAEAKARADAVEAATSVRGQLDQLLRQLDGGDTAAVTVLENGRIRVELDLVAAVDLIEQFAP